MNSEELKRLGNAAIFTGLLIGGFAVYTIAKNGLQAIKNKDKPVNIQFVDNQTILLTDSSMLPDILDKPGVTDSVYTGQDTSVIAALKKQGKVFGEFIGDSSYFVRHKEFYDGYNNDTLKANIIR